MRRALTLALCLPLWWSLLHLVFRPTSRVDLVSRLTFGQQRAWTDESARGALRRSNPEWDLMHRLFTVLALANQALADPGARAAHLGLVDGIVEDTLELEARHGHPHFLLPYAQGEPFRASADQRSLFVDGELALMLAARQAVEPSARWVAPLQARVAVLERAFASAPAGFPESYPDEGWTFCNTVALAALRVADHVQGTDHRALFDTWLARARRTLVDSSTGLLVSSFHADAAPRDGPEGSTLWLAAHMLVLIDPTFARQQYDGAKRLLGRHALGFGWATEWPQSWRGQADVDSGPTIPLVDAHAGSSGLAVLGAAAFEDEAFEEELLTSLHFAAFPSDDDGARRYLAGNVLADAVVLYALSQGPLWTAVRRGARS